MQNIDASSLVKERKRQISDLARESFPSIDYPQAQEVTSLTPTFSKESFTL